MMVELKQKTGANKIQGVAIAKHLAIHKLNNKKTMIKNLFNKPTKKFMKKNYQFMKKNYQD